MALSTQLIWFLVGVVFLIAELALPGFILIFFTAGCWITAIVSWLVDIDLTFQILIFIISSLAFLFTIRKFCINVFRGKTKDLIDDQYADSKIGKTAIVTKSIAPNLPGEIKFMGSYWRAVADIQINAGKTVIIQSRESEDGLSFKVKMTKGEE